MQYGDRTSGTRLYYGFSVTQGTTTFNSPVGSFRAINAANNMTTLNYAVVSCSNWGCAHIAPPARCLLGTVKRMHRVRSAAWLTLTLCFVLRFGAFNAYDMLAKVDNLDFYSNVGDNM